MTHRDVLETILVLLVIACVAAWTRGSDPEGAKPGLDGADVIVRYAE